MHATWIDTATPDEGSLHKAAAKLGTIATSLDQAGVILTDQDPNEVLALTAKARPDQVILVVASETHYPDFVRQMGHRLDDVVRAPACSDELVARAKAAVDGRSDKELRSILRLVAHDLNNSLGAVRLLSEMLQGQHNDPETAQDLSDILESSDIAIALVDNLSGYLKTVDGSGKPPVLVDVGQVLRTLLERPFIRGKIEPELTSEPTLVLAEPAGLRNAVIEMLSTARRSTVTVGSSKVILSRTADEVRLMVHITSPNLKLDGADPRKRFAGGEPSVHPSGLLPTALWATDVMAQRCGGALDIEGGHGQLGLVLRLPAAPLR
ncbi:MAG: sensor histidine kinase [Myxococcota bacterium]